METTRVLLKTGEVCAILRCDPRTVRRWADEGKLNVVRVGASGKHRRFYADEVAAMLQTPAPLDLDRVLQALDRVLDAPYIPVEAAERIRRDFGEALAGLPWPDTGARPGGSPDQPSRDPGPGAI